MTLCSRRWLLPFLLIAGLAASPLVPALADSDNRVQNVSRPDQSISRLAPLISQLRRNVAFKADWRRLCRRFPGPRDQYLIVVDIGRQRLYLFDDGHRTASWKVSTSIYGTGERMGSFQTPLGVFRIIRKIGTHLPPDEVIQDQAPTGRFVRPVYARDDLAASHWITGRLLWLGGLQPRWNEGGKVDTYLRHIYIHGTPNLGMLGQPASFGCVQMAPRAIISLYRRVPPGTLVMITPGRRKTVFAMARM